MLDGVQGHAAQHARRLVAQPGGHPRVRCFMQAQRKEENHVLKNLKNNLLLAHTTKSMVSGLAVQAHAPTLRGRQISLRVNVEESRLSSRVRRWNPPIFVPFLDPLSQKEVRCGSPRS